MQWPDIDLGMSGFLDFIKSNPFSKGLDILDKTIDKAVPDKDLAAELKTQVAVLKETSSTQVQLAILAVSQEAQKTEQVALQRVTHPILDGIHKLGRQAITLIVLYADYLIIMGHIENKIPITMDTVALLTVFNALAGIYTVVKGRGRI